MSKPTGIGKTSVIAMTAQRIKMSEYILILSVVNTLLIILTLMKVEAGKDE